MEEKHICKNCGSELVEKKTKRTAEQLKKPYYYSAYYYCNNCHKLYHDDKFKVTNPVTTPLHFGSLELEPKTDEVDAEIWTDGACIYNGTPRARAAWGFVSGKTERAGRVEGKQTNNVAEGLAIYNALVWAAEQGHKKIRLHTDSQISLFNLRKSPDKVKQNAEIFYGIARVIAENNLTVEYVKVLGHSGDINNERADKLANTMATQS
jgi:ribonuclease HI